jgi:hypothetical protein
MACRLSRQKKTTGKRFVAYRDGRKRQKISLSPVATEDLDSYDWRENDRKTRVAFATEDLDRKLGCCICHSIWRQGTKNLLFSALHSILPATDNIIVGHWVIRTDPWPPWPMTRWLIVISGPNAVRSSHLLTAWARSLMHRLVDMPNGKYAPIKIIYFCFLFVMKFVR